MDDGICLGDSSDIWNIVHLCLMWTVWRKRNSRIFKDKEKYERQLLDGFATSLFEWSRVWGFTSSIYVLDFISSLSLISNTSYSVNI